MKKNTLRKSRGVAMIYALVIMTALCMILSLAVDYGHAQLVKTELRRTADASARAAAAYIYSDQTAGIAAAVDVANRNLVDGSGLKLLPAQQDIQYGFWDVNTKTFSTNVSSSLINAVRVVAQKSKARGTAIPMMFASILGRNTCDAKAESIVMVIQPLNVNQNVPGTSNPFLAGMPAGSEASNINPHNSPDFAGDASNPNGSPIAIDMPITQGETLNFDSIDGTTRHDPNDPYYSPDGNPASDQWGHNILNKDGSQSSYQDPTTLNTYSQNGIANMNAPINALVGVFLDDKQPNMSAPPAALDFSTADSRDFNSIGSKETGGTIKDQPLKLKQIFFIGDGANSKGVKQSFIAPKGATRLFLATWDFYEWNNNGGLRTIKITRPGQIITVK